MFPALHASRRGEAAPRLYTVSHILKSELIEVSPSAVLVRREASKI